MMIAVLLVGLPTAAAVLYWRLIRLSAAYRDKAVFHGRLEQVDARLENPWQTELPFLIECPCHS
jgi:hypothetical protein